jgi:Rrf2 family protein
MKLSAQQEYGLRCMVHMAREGAGESVNIETIAEHEALTPAYVAKLMRILRNAALIVSIRGQHGGYKLARPSVDVTVQEILLALGDRLFTEGFCERHAGNAALCTHDADCAIRALWSGLDHVVDSFLSTCRLADLVRPEGALHSWLGGHLQQLPELVKLPTSRPRGPASTPRAVSPPDSDGSPSTAISPIEG